MNEKTQIDYKFILKGDLDMSTEPYYPNGIGNSLPNTKSAQKAGNSIIATGLIIYWITRGIIPWLPSALFSLEWNHGVRS